ncbi:two component transcriptional regulator, LytTR family [Chitinophaga sp. CF118]|uniref:LytR/AlgR family response regulator transcription factor n=1 Tax=Chitinophaga sp. CF118 TaxID=1884367 RepID=UPI0008EC4794|nr:LytTR family DNA-binding domain-containing protein [Chitinophaga sp. CF118]SFF09939.1 two component transcriptional regulator, LytTR family [Chitinophaga sp. CF118]
MIQNILILEDEKPNADRLKRLIKMIRPGINIIAVLESVTEAVTWISHNESPDLVMMDVRLADGLSFDIFEKVELKCPIIFTTAYDEYAIRAFKYNSIDYLLKPVETEELERAFTVLESRLQNDTQKSIENVLNFINPKDYRSRFLLPFRDGYKTLLVDDVEYYYSELKITRAKLLNGNEEILQQSMEELELQLDPTRFFRANRQFIIHIDAVQQIHNYFNGKLKVILKNNKNVEIIVSRDKASLLKKWMDF